VSRRTLIILLIVSGGLNLFLAGVITTSIIVHVNRPELGHGPSRRAGFRLFLAVRELPEPHRAKAQALLREKRPEIRAKIRAVRVARRELGRMLRDGTASAEQIEAGFQKLHRTRGEAQTALHALVRQIVEKLPSAERKKFYRTAFKPRRHRHRRHERRERERREERRD